MLPAFDLAAVPALSRGARCLPLLSLPLPRPGARTARPQERLDRLERDLNMLQRQVYRGAPTPATARRPSAAVNAEIRMDRLEAQMRDLTGRVEEFTNQVDAAAPAASSRSTATSRCALSRPGRPIAAAAPPAGRGRGVGRRRDRRGRRRPPRAGRPPLG